MFCATGALTFILTQSFAAAVDRPRDVPISEPSATAPRPAVEPPKKSGFDRLWDSLTFYKNDESDFLNEFRFVGRAQFDQYMVDSALGHDQDWIVRRLRFGGKGRLFHHLDFHAEVEMDPQNDDPAYRRLTDAYLAWNFSKAVKFIAGKHSVKFTLDGSTSSKELLTIDRNNTANNFWFPAEYIPGVSLSGEIGPWVYNTGFYSGGSESPEFGNFDAGNFWLGSIGYDFGKQIGVEQALLRADYVFNDPNAESTFTRSFEQIASLVFIFDAKRWGVSADVTAGRGSVQQSDAFGVVLMPWVNITDKLQFVGRYNYIASDEPNGVRFSRYENFQTSGRGDEYHEFYAGLNYFFYGHRLKVQTGFA
nr:OprO/OprP family phosphate-selective porin [Verrucomicrobiota bacterium]